MAIKPILFNTEMVRAILNGRKSCTRRLVKFLPGQNPNWTGYEKCGLILYNGRNEPCNKKAPYQPGDILYVRETWNTYCEGCLSKNLENVLGSTCNHSCGENGNGYYYKTTDDKNHVKWRPSIHMPKEAARIWLKVTDVRVERLKDMTDNDALKEGAEGVRCNHAGLGPHGCTDCMNTGWLEPPLLEFMGIWNSTIKKSDLDRYGWDANPYVWVIEFERCEKPEGV